jgi:hypothetical protein
MVVRRLSTIMNNWDWLISSTNFWYIKFWEIKVRWIALKQLASLFFLSFFFCFWWCVLLTLFINLKCPTDSHKTTFSPIYQIPVIFIINQIFITGVLPNKLSSEALKCGKRDLKWILRMGNKANSFLTFGW